MKKFLAILLSVLLLCACLPLGAISVSAATSGTAGDCTWTLDGTHLTISGNGAIGDYHWKYGVGGYHTNAPWGGKITSVTIEEGVTTIGECAFYGCDNLQSVTIGDSVTTIGVLAFSDCGSLRIVTIPDSVTTIEASAFNECDDLQSVYYTGTEEDYANMVIKDRNSCLLDATWHYEYGKEESKNDTEDRLSAKEGFNWRNVVEVVLLIVIIVLLLLLYQKKKSA